jgi:hypothetical protein
MAGNPFPVEWSSRETAVQLPHSFAMLGYLMFNHRIPRILFNEEGVAYHYCDSAGLLGILDTHRFWASNAVFLNDPTEGLYAIEIARGFLEDRRKATGVAGKFAAAVLERIHASSETDLYVVSFSRDGDLLSQWRGYGDFGRGFSLGFDMAKLNPPVQLGWLIEVLYDPEHLRLTLEDIFGIYTEFLDAEGPLADFDDVASWCVPVLNLLAQGFKHPSYQQEQEVRLLFQRSRNPEQQDQDRGWYGLPISYRARGSNIVSYLDIGLDRPGPDQRSHLPLSRIIVGPGVSFAQNEGSIRGFLASKGYENVEIIPSAIPFRP